MFLESLEDRAVPAVFDISSGVAADLIAAINTANTNGDPSNTINLTGTYTLTSVDNYWYGPTGLPAITSDLTIAGNPTIPTVIQRSTGGSTPNFRLLYVAAAQSGLAYGTLTLADLTLSGGVAQGGNAGSGGGGMGAGGAIFNMGTTRLQGVTLANNMAIGGTSGINSGAGGGGIGSDNDGDNGGGFGGPAPGAAGGSGWAGMGETGGGGGFNASDGAVSNSYHGGNGGGSGNLGGAAGEGGTYGDGGGGTRYPMDGAAGGDFGEGGQGSGGDAGGGGVGGGGGGGGNGAGGGFGGGGGGNPTWGGGGAGGGGGFGGGGGASNPDSAGAPGGCGAGGSGSVALGHGGGGGGAGLGGAVFNFTGDLAVINSTIAGNTAIGGNATWAAQPGGGFGGGVFNLNGHVTLVNATFAQNVALSGSHFGSGTGQAAVPSDGLDLYSLAFGREWREGAGFTKGDPVVASLQMANTLMASWLPGLSALATQADSSARSTGVGGPDSTFADAATTGPLVPTNVIRGISGPLTLGYADTITVPDLDPAGLADNGGPTPTIALKSQLSTSLAPGTTVFGVYSIPTTDQRGIARPVATDLGAFQMALPPTATLDSAPAVTAASAAGSTTTVTVTYTDQSGSGIDTSTFGIGNLAVSHGATVTGYSAVGNTVTYTVSAPGASWSSSPQGTYTIALVAGSVQDNNGDGIEGIAGFGTFLVETTLPTATPIAAPTVGASAAGASTTTVTVAYDDAASGIDTSTFGIGNIAVSNGATVTGYSAVGNAVTYTISAPGASWSSSPQGTYGIALVAGSVQDLVGNPIAGDPAFGSFLVDTGSPVASLAWAPTVDATVAAGSTTTVTISYYDPVSGIDTSTFGIGNIAVSNGATVVGYSAIGNVVTYTIAAPAASWSSSTQGSYAVALMAGSVKDLAGNPIEGDPAFGSFLVDTVAPTAVLISAPTVDAAGAASSTTTISIVYSDAVSGIDTSTFGIGNIAVSNGAAVVGYSAIGNVVTYTIAAPASDWSGSTQGTYSVALVAGSVRDLAGNPIAGDPSFGSFLVDSVAPIAALISAPTVDATGAASSTTTITVAYGDAVSGIDTATYGIGNITVSHGATVTGYSAVGNVVTYTIAAPAGTWSSSTQGSYALALVAGSVRDLAGNAIAGDPAFASFLVDTAPPTGTLTSAPTVDATAAAGSTTAVAITYFDPVSGIDSSTFGIGNITVSNGATVTGYSAVGNTVTYTITAPGATWSSSVPGTYTVSMVAGSVRDLAGNAIAGDPAFASFLVDTAPPTGTLISAPTVNSTTAATTTAVIIAYGDAISGIDSSTFGIGNITVSNGATVTGYSAVGNVVTYTIAAPAGTWSSSTQGAYIVALVAGSVKDLAGNAMAGDSEFGSFLVDTDLPTATVTSSPPIHAPEAANATTSVTITYTDVVSGIDSSTFGIGNITVSNGATVTGYSVTGNTVTYTITAPGATWVSSPQGTYTIALLAGSVRDLAGNPNAGVDNLGLFTVDVSIRVATTATASVSPTSPAFGEAVVLGATISGNVGVLKPGGTVAFYDGPTLLGTAPVGPDGTATFMLQPGLGSGSHSIAVSYLGDPVFDPSISPTVPVAVSPSTTSTVGVVSSASRVNYGQAVTLTATFRAPSDGVTPMTGTVAYYDGSTFLGSVPITTPLGVRAVPGASSTGQANLTVSLGAGDHAITAVYSGDANFAPASSSIAAHVAVARATTSASLAVQTSGNSATLVGRIVATSPGTPPLAGMVRFYDNGVLVGSAPLVGGAATLSLANLAPGKHGFTAIFPGGQNVKASDSKAVAVMVSSNRVTSLARYGYHWKPTTLVITFSGAVDPTVASNAARYVVTGPVAGRQRGPRIPVASATYDSQSHSVTLSFHQRLGLFRTYTLSIPDIHYTGVINRMILAGPSPRMAPTGTR